MRKLYLSSFILLIYKQFDEQPKGSQIVRKLRSYTTLLRSLRIPELLRHISFNRSISVKLPLSLWIIKDLISNAFPFTVNHIGEQTHRYSNDNTQRQRSCFVQTRSTMPRVTRGIYIKRQSMYETCNGSFPNGPLK